MTKTDSPAPETLTSIALPTGGGLLGMSQYPGRCDPGTRADTRRRILQSDLRAIQSWGAHALISLTPRDEMRRLGVDHLGELAESMGMTWYLLPITDMEAPDALFDQRWQYVGPRLRELLRGGGRVMVHCRAGLGRTGAIVARLLVELGVPPSEAVSQVRQARPGAIQTTAQEKYVMAQKRVSEAGDRLYTRRLACLLGGAVGDAFAFVHFSRPAQPSGGLRQPLLQDGQLRVSDDTQLNLFSLEGLIRSLRGRQTDDDALLKQMRLSWQDWLQTQGHRTKMVWHASHLLKHAALHVRRQPGLTNLSALEAGASGTPETPINSGQACGALQRVGAIGLLPGMTARRAFDLAVRAAASTHGHVNGQLPAGVLAALLAELMHGQQPHAALDGIMPLLQARAGHDETLAALSLVLHKSGQTHFGRSARALPHALSAPGALAVGLYAALVGRDLHEVLHLASDPEHGSESAAAIAGQVYGAWHGIAAVPHAWAVSLDVFDAICELLHWAGPLLRKSI